MIESGPGTAAVPAEAAATMAAAAAAATLAGRLQKLRTRSYLQKQSTRSRAPSRQLIFQSSPVGHGGRSPTRTAAS